MGIFKDIIGIIGSSFSLNKGGKVIIELTVDPTTASGVNAPAGSFGMWNDSGTGRQYKKDDNGLSTNWTELGIGGIPESIKSSKNQTTHGFVVKNAIYHNGTIWVKAQSNAIGTIGTHIVIAVADVDNFTMSNSGRHPLTAHGFTVGVIHFVSDATPGLLTTTEPTSVNSFSNQLMIPVDANTIDIYQWRVKVIGGSAITQARRTTAYTLTATFADITLDTTDEESEPLIIDHDSVTNTDRITALRTGLYRISYGVKGTRTGGALVSVRVRVNDTTVIPGSLADSGIGTHNQNHDYNFTCTFVTLLTADDFITLQAEETVGSASTLLAGAYISINTVNGIQGGPGPAGPAGPAGETLRDQIERFKADIVDFPSVVGEGFAPAPIDKIGANALYTIDFPDTTSTAVLSELTLKDDVNTAGSVTIEIRGFAQTTPVPPADQVKYKLKMWIVQDGTTLSVTPTTVDIDTFTVTTSVNNQVLSKVLTMAALGWLVDREVRFLLIREGGVTNDLTDNHKVTSLTFKIPRV